MTIAASRRLGSLDVDLMLLEMAVKAGDPEKEILLRISDMRRQIKVVRGPELTKAIMDPPFNHRKLGNDW